MTERLRCTPVPVDDYFMMRPNSVPPIDPELLYVLDDRLTPEWDEQAAQNNLSERTYVCDRGDN